MSQAFSAASRRGRNTGRSGGNVGFTLTELMAVVVIVGILAALGSVGYSRYIRSAKSSEAVWMVNGIRAAQEAYRAETLTYLNVSESLANYYPTTTPGKVKIQWGGGNDAIANRWRVLAVTTDGAVYYGYSVIAGPPGPVEAVGIDGGFSFITIPDEATEPWYIIQAKGDLDEDGIPSLYLGSSLSSEVYWVNEGG
ncbi:MAG: prepilin-type N-terminal cleavage/methylation domain-containing protein [Polyangiaceae bacterium]|nr:prepilin-type N-terminal cleavage/methylation domain-containing protein [Polyangiaceae bacterium]